jgi:hypothetical protein
VRWWWRFWCKHFSTVRGTETFGSPEYDEIWVNVYCANPKCRKVIGRHVVGYAGDGICL